jgi:hypothetical protein
MADECRRCRLCRQGLDSSGVQHPRKNLSRPSSLLYCLPYSQKYHLFHGNQLEIGPSQSHAGKWLSWVERRTKSTRATVFVKKKHVLRRYGASLQRFEKVRYPSEQEVMILFGVHCDEGQHPRASPTDVASNVSATELIMRSCKNRYRPGTVCKCPNVVSITMCTARDELRHLSFSNSEMLD